MFETVARCGSFKDAAAALCVSQSAVSHQIRHLEEWLGRSLFDRSGQRPKPLPHAQVLADTLRHSLQGIDSACRLARGKLTHETLVIASIPSVAICWLIPRLSDLQARHPDIGTRLVYAFHGRDIDFDQVDLAFVFADGPPALPGHQTRLFQSGASVPVCSPALRDTLGSVVSREAIVDAGLLHDTDTGGWTVWLGQAGLDPVPPITGAIFEDFNLLRAAALAGQGVALCPLALIGADLASHRLVQLSNLVVNQGFDYYLIQRDSNGPETASASDHFVTWVLDMLDEGSEPSCSEAK